MQQKASDLMRERDIKSSPKVDAAAILAGTEAAAGRVASELEHSERLATVGILAAGVLHEIHNILTPVLAYAQLAWAHPDDPDLQAKATEKTIHGIESATRIAAAILGFAGRDDATEADIAQVLANALDCMARNPNKDRIKLNTDVQPGLVVRMNPLSLQQVLMNLLINAQVAMGERGGRVTVAAITRADGTVGIRVTDTGPGIPKEIAGRIFEPFFTTNRCEGDHRASSDSAADVGARQGTGLGLAICRRLVEQAGGTITAMSKPGEGTTFIITLPATVTRRAKAG